MQSIEFNRCIQATNDGPISMRPLLAQRLRAARQAINPPVTQRQVAARLDLSASAINLWESGKTQPSAEHLAELARWYEVSADWLLGVESNRPAPRDKPLIWTVPVVAPDSLRAWHWEAVSQHLQTAVLYPPSTAAAILVATDALTSSCPAGAYAVVSKAHPAELGAVVVAALSRAAEPMLRRLVKDGSDQLLVADDMRYPTHKLADGARILGRVTEITIRKSLL